VVLVVVGVLVQVLLALQWFGADQTDCPVPLARQFAAQVTENSKNYQNRKRAILSSSKI
jgi:hypothetical protein